MWLCAKGIQRRHRLVRWVRYEGCSEPEHICHLLLTAGPVSEDRYDDSERVTVRELRKHSAGQPGVGRRPLCTSTTCLLPSCLPAEFQRQESVRPQHKGIQLYDTPYEPEGQSVDSDSESTVSLRLRESKLPQDDDRPADEYDQPWEWNRVTIPALAGRSSVPAWEAVTEQKTSGSSLAR